MERKSDPYDPKIEGYLMYKYLVCEALFSPHSIPVHLSEPFNIKIEYMRISNDWVDLELLDKSLEVIEKIKLNTITSIELSVNKESSLSTSTGSISTPNSLSTSTSTMSSPPPQLLRSNSISGKAGSLLGIGISPDSSEQQTTPLTGSKKANLLLGFDDNAEGDKNKSLSKKPSALANTSANSPKFGLLARSASNTLLNVKKENQQETVGSPNTSFLLSSSPNPSPLSMSVGGSNPLASSTSSLSSSGSGSFIGGGSNLSLNSGISSGSMNGSGLGHYNKAFSILTKSLTYSFNAREKEELNTILDALKMISTGKPHQEQTVQTFDAIVEALTIANQCKPPNIPSLPSSPPPPPPLLKLTQ